MGEKYSLRRKVRQFRAKQKPQRQGLPVAAWGGYQTHRKVVERVIFFVDLQTARLEDEDDRPYLSAPPQEAALVPPDAFEVILLS